MRSEFAALDPNTLRWIATRDLRAPTPDAPDESAQRARSLAYLDACYRYPAGWLTTETWSGCRLGCPEEGRPETDADASTDGTWAFAFAVPHYLRRHGYSLPSHVLDDLRQRNFEVPELPTDRDHVP